MAAENYSDNDVDHDIIFSKAREFLQLVGRTQPNSTDDDLSKAWPSTLFSTDIQSNSNSSKEKRLKRKLVLFEATKTMKLGNTEHDEITPHKRRKLEKVKVPVTSFVKPIKETEIPTCDEDESVNKMLQHMRQLPEQDVYSPQSISMDEDGVCNTGSGSMKYVYLSSEKDLATWKLLKNSLTNRNVFAGNLSYKVDQSLLKSVFETLVAKEQQHILKVRLVTDAHSGVSKGYGFVEFPYRRAAELAFICLQGFEVYGREMQLGWGQNIGETTQHCFKDQSTCKNGTIISDSQRSRMHKVDTCMRRRRWDVEQHEINSEITEPQHGLVSHASESISGKNNDLSIQKTSLRSEENEKSGPLCSIRQHCGHLLKSSTGDKRTAIEWLSKEQRVNLIKAVCENLRNKNVAGHIGVFGEYFETDNTELHVTFSKDLPEKGLGSTFAQFGKFNLNTTE